MPESSPPFPEGVPPDDEALADEALADDPPVALPADEEAPNRKKPADELSLQALIARYVREHLPSRERPRTREEPPRTVGTHAKLIPILQLVPWLLGTLFVTSFVWDFPGMTLMAFGTTLPLEGLLRILSVSGLIGFLTNWLAITMLFQPRTPRPLIGQGLVPAQRERIAFRLAEAVSDELISERIIKQKIHESGLIAEYRTLTVSVVRSMVDDPTFRAELKAVVTNFVDDLLASEEVRQRIVDFTEEQIEAYAGQGLAGVALRAYRFVNEEEFQARLHKAVRRLPDSLDPLLDDLDPILEEIPGQLSEQSEDIEDLLTQLVLSFVENLDVERIVVQNVRAYDEQQLEELLKRTTNEQLNYIKYLGGVLGLVGGFVIWEPLAALTALGTVGGTIFILDETLHRLRRGASLAD